MKFIPKTKTAWRFALMGAFALMSGVQAQALSIAIAPSWVNESSYGSIVATDCAFDTCGRNIEIACQGEGAPANVRLTGLASGKQFPVVKAPLTVLIDGQRFTRTATTSYDPSYGFIPQFLMQPDDPLVEALAAGEYAEFIFAERAGTVELTESRWALSVFVAHCAWQEPQARAVLNVQQSGVPEGAAGIYDRRRRGYVLGCANTPGLNGRTMTLDASSADAGHVSFRLPEFADNGRAFSPPVMGNLALFGDVFVDLLMIEGGMPSDWQITMRPSPSGSYAQAAQMDLEVPDYGIISCRADAIF